MTRGKDVIKRYDVTTILTVIQIWDVILEEDVRWLYDYGYHGDQSLRIVMMSYDKCS